jgi:hypothetical protein
VGGLDLYFIYESIGAVIGAAILCYLAMVLIFRKSIMSITDPFNLQLLLLCAYLAGTVLLGLYYTPNATYFYTLLIIATYVLSGGVVENLRRRSPVRYPISFPTREVQRVFAYGITGAQILNLIANYVFGFIPLLQGTESRALAGDLPIVSLQVFQPVLLTLSMYMMFFAPWAEITFISVGGVLAGVVASILGGSKSAIFVIVSAFATYDYLLNWRVRAGLAPKRGAHLIRKTRKWIAAMLVLTVITLPAYLLAIGSGQDLLGSAVGIVIRLFGGFDGLAALVQGGVDFHDVPKLNLIQIYFYPFFAKLGIPPEFKAVGAYISYLRTGDYTLATSSLYPNSTLPLELLFSFSSVVVVFVLTIAIAVAIFYVRRLVLDSVRWRMLHLFIFGLVAIAPISMLIDGAYFVNLLYFELMFYIVVNTILNAARMVRTGRLTYAFF